MLETLESYVLIQGKGGNISPFISISMRHYSLWKRWWVLWMELQIGSNLHYFSIFITTLNVYRSISFEQSTIFYFKLNKLHVKFETEDKNLKQ